MADDPKTPNVNVANRAGRAGDPNPVYRTQADLDAEKSGAEPAAARTLGLSQSPGLVPIEGSKVRGLLGATVVNHVQGPGQAPVDPVAAGLDTANMAKPKDAEPAEAAEPAKAADAAKPAAKPAAT
jgi:hypothetical protein